MQSVWVLNCHNDFGWPPVAMCTKLVKFVTFEDLRAAGLKVALARELMDRFQLGGDIYNSLVISGRLIPTKHEAPKRGTLGDGGNPNDDSSTSNVTSSIHSQMSGTTHFPLDMATRRVITGELPNPHQPWGQCEERYNTITT